MAYPKKMKGWRTIVVDDTEYLWKFVPGAKGSSLKVLPGAQSGSGIEIILTDWIDPWLNLSADKPTVNEPSVITPSFVETAIRFALANNWSPETRTAPPAIEFSDNNFICTSEQAGEIRDYNGQGRWSREEIERRFKSYAKAFGTTGLELNPRIYEESSTTWIYPLIEEAIVGIEQGDLACIELGVELIEDSGSMPFGMILKSNTAKALRHSADHLSEDHRRRIRKRVADMLIEQYMPREFVQYVKLARTVGFAAELERVRSEADLTNRWVRHYLERLTERDKIAKPEGLK